MPKKFTTITRVRGFYFEAETIRTEHPSDHPSAPAQTSGVETSESLRPSRPGPGLASGKPNLFLLPASRKVG